jgi:hypothetical protein
MERQHLTHAMVTSYMAKPSATTRRTGREEGYGWATRHDHKRMAWRGGDGLRHLMLHL